MATARTPYERGVSARRRGKERHDNPYTNETTRQSEKFRAWLRGYTDQENSTVVSDLAPPRPMTGFFAGLTDEQKAAALAYRGPENHGSKEGGMKQKYEIGDDAWIYLGNHHGKLTQGRVVHKFSLEGWSVAEHYVVEISTSVDWLLEVRDPFSMSPTAEGPIGIWSLVEETRRTDGR